MPTSSVIGSGMTVRKFDTWGEWVEFCQRPGQTRQRSSRERGEDWSGSRNFEDAIRIAKNGWDKHRAEVQSLSDEISHRLQEVLEESFTQVWDVSGASVDIGRFMTGEPECLSNVIPVRESTVGKVVTVLVNCRFASAVSSKEIIQRGQGICALVECLESVQHSVELWCETQFTCDDGKTGVTYLVCVKSSTDPMDIDRLMFAIGHPSAFRRLGFAALESEESNSINYIAGRQYGYRTVTIGHRVVGGDVVLDELRYRESVEGWVMRELGKLGVLREEI